MDAARLSILDDRFASVPEEMGYVLQRSAYSANIKERMDASCGIYDEHGRLLAQAEHIPVHLGSMPSAVSEVMDAFEGDLREGDQIILNDPYRGGTHLPDITLIRPVFHREDVIAYCATRAHHSDVGSDTPGSLPPYSRRLEEEGMVIPPYFLVRDGKLNEELVETIRREMRNPGERIGDLHAQMGANRRGCRRIQELVDDLGGPEFRSAGRDLRAYASRMMRDRLHTIRDGTFSARDNLESGGREGEPVRIECTVSIRGKTITFDFTGTARQVPGNVNAPPAVTRSACYYVMRCLADDSIPANHGCFDMIDVEIPEGTLLNPEPGHAVCSGNVETSQRVVDVLLEALREPLPGIIPAQSQGTMNNLVIGSGEEQEEWTYYETIGGGEGAFPDRDGRSGIHTHMTNTRNTPVEALEHEFPLRVNRYHLRDQSGGSGAFSGGEGVVREIEFCGEKGTFTIISERRSRSPSGAKGGGDGRPGKNILLLSDGTRQDIGARATGPLKRGDRICVKTPGGGGFQSAKEEHSDA